METIVGQYREKHGIISDQRTLREKMKDNVRRYAKYVESKKVSGR